MILSLQDKRWDVLGDDFVAILKKKHSFMSNYGMGEWRAEKEIETERMFIVARAKKLFRNVSI